MHPSKMPGVIFRELGGEPLSEAIINGERWRVAPGKTGSGFVGVREDTISTAIAVWPDLPKDGDQPTLEMVFSLTTPSGWAPVDSKMDTGFAKIKYGAHWLAFAVLVYARQVAGTGRTLKQ